MRPHRLLLLAVGMAAVTVAPSFAAAEPATDTTVPATDTTLPAADTTLPATTVAPATTAAPAPTAEAPVPEASIAVGDEAQYRAALAALSADASGPHTIDLTGDVTVDDVPEAVYTGTQDLTIDGHGFTLNAERVGRLLVVDSPTDAALHLRHVTMFRGLGVGDGGAVLVQNQSPVSIDDTHFVYNHATGSGGAIAAPEVVTVTRSHFFDNSAGSGDGGAIHTAADGNVTVIESSFTRNYAFAGRGGAISSVAAGVASDAGVQRSSFVGNHANEGGAIVLGSSGVVSNSTFLGNVATVSGGAVLAEGQSMKVLVYDTITANSAPEGANLTNRGHDLRVVFSVLAEPGGGSNCAFPQGEFHLTESRTDDASCPGARQVDDVLLGPLGHHGGHTVTRVPLPGSPLIDAIDANYGYPSIPGGCAGFGGLGSPDQRGVSRPQDGDGRSRAYDFAGTTYYEDADCDIGAVEVEAFVAPPAPPTGPVAGGPTFTG